MKNSTHPFSWVQKVDESLRELDRIPLGGNAERLDLKLIGEALAARFGEQNLSIALDNGSWKKADKALEKVGTHPLTLGIKLLPLAGEALWVMSRKEVKRLSSYLLLKEKDQEIASETLQDGFYRYLVLHVLDALQEIGPLQQFSLQLEDEIPSVHENSYCVDIQLALSEDKTCHGRLIFSSDLMLSWQKHFASLHYPFTLAPVAKSIELCLSIKTGSALLERKTWESLEIGDVLLLDRGSYDPRHKEGIATLSLGTTPLFHIAIKENKIKLLDYALFYEEDMKNEQDIEAKELLAPEEGRTMAVKELPLNVTVELARLRMTVDQLMQLSPGNFLQLPIHPEQGVVLSINGQKVGRGEMIYLGDALGIRILELADK